MLNQKYMISFLVFLLTLSFVLTSCRVEKTESPGSSSEPITGISSQTSSVKQIQSSSSSSSTTITEKSRTPSKTTSSSRVSRTTASAHEDTVPKKSKFSTYLSRSVDKLMDGGKEVRFVSFNLPNLVYNENPYWHLNSDWEIKDAFETVIQLGSPVIRTYTLSISGGKKNRNFFYGGPGIYNEEMFRQLDKVLAYANSYGVRIVVPFIDYWEYEGGIKQFAAFRNKLPNEFYTDPQVKQDFKNYLNYILNRKNVYTGVRYKDDKAIAFWETGNELTMEGANIYDTSDLDAWTIEMAGYIKSIDRKHLIMDGKNVNDSRISDTILNSPQIDILNAHYYMGEFASKEALHRQKTKGKKIFIVGEYGDRDIKKCENLVNEVINNGTTGIMAWALETHNESGGFYLNHTDNGFVHHWPGTNNNNCKELDRIMFLRDASFRIRGLPTPPIPVPKAPVMNRITGTDNIRWKGSVGAGSYIVERSENPKGPFTVLDSNFVDDVDFFGGFEDTGAVSGKTYYYRVKAKNESGVSGYSNVESYSK